VAGWFGAETPGAWLWRAHQADWVDIDLWHNPRDMRQSGATTTTALPDYRWQTTPGQRRLGAQQQFSPNIDAFK